MTLDAVPLLPSPAHEKYKNKMRFNYSPTDSSCQTSLNATEDPNHGRTLDFVLKCLRVE